MKRPSFQFYPADWRNNAKLRRCSPAARGAWMDVLCVLHDSDEYGVCRWPLADLANAAGVAIKWLRELIEKDVLKGADSEAVDFIHTPRHAGKDGEPVTLVKAGNGPCWYCTRFARDEWIRGRRGIGSRFDSENQPGRNSDGGGQKTAIDSSTKPTARNAPTGAPTRRVGERVGERVGVDDERPISSLFDEKSLNFEEKTSIGAMPQLEVDIAASIENITKNAEPTRRVGERLGDGSSSTSTSLNTKTTTKSKDKGLARCVDLLSEIDPQIVADWAEIRKAKNLPITRTAIAGIKREAAKIGFSLQQALATCCENTWAGFKVAWLDTNNINGKSYKASKADLDVPVWER